MKVFTTRSTTVAIATGTLVAVLFGPLIGAPWGLAVLNGTAIGALVLLVNCAARLGLFRPKLRDPATMWRWRPQLGIFMLTWVVLLMPASYVQFAVELDLAIEAALTSLFFAVGFGAYLGGMVVAKLDYLDDENQPPPRNLIPPDGE